ncbi:MAG TPA: hypothetical protein VGS07_07315 [Thermoanaerobaculia bacterium]|jgi:hypothetical protein|nr:hypothetical protein [Thermoanaerobaculia bacterium]
MAWRDAFLFRAGLITPLLLLTTLAFIEGCAHNYSYQIFPGEAPQDIFPQIKNRDQLWLSGNEAGVELRVFYAAGEKELAEEALEEVKKPPRFLHEATGITQNDFAGFYLYPTLDDGTTPYFTTNGKGSFTGVFLYRKGEPLLSIYHNREWLNGSYVHELTHGFLSGVKLDDRWLEDGIPEYLTREFAQYQDPELARGDYRLTPSLIALSRAKLKPWDMRDYKEIEKQLSTDPALAQWLGEKMAWHYAAAEELMRRWLVAAQANGIQAPLQDLLRRVRARGGSIGWKATEELAQAQTGKPIEELAHVTSEELAAAQAKAWEDRASSNLGARVHALSVLSALGIPNAQSSDDLLPVFSIPPDLSDVKRGWVWQVFQQGGTAVATVNDAAIAKEVVERARAGWGEDGYRFVPPELWRVIAATDRPLAIGQLVAIVNRSDNNLSLRDRANEVLKALTGQDVGWSAAESPTKRQQAAERWKAAQLGH